MVKNHFLKVLYNLIFLDEETIDYDLDSEEELEEFMVESITKS